MPRHFLDEIHFSRDVDAPGRDVDVPCGWRERSRWARRIRGVVQREAEALEDSPDVRIGHRCAKQSFDLRAPQPQRLRLDPRRVPVDNRAARTAGANRFEQRARALHRRHWKTRIGAAFEAHARLGLQRQLPARAAHRKRIEVRALEHDDGCPLGDFGCRATHDAGNGDGPFGVGNDQHVGGELARLSIEGLDRFASLRRPHANLRAGQFREVERVHRMSHLEQHVVGDVDDVADGTDAGGLQPCLHPRGRGPDGHVRDSAGVSRTQIGILDDDVDV